MPVEGKRWWEQMKHHGGVWRGARPRNCIFEDGAVQNSEPRICRVRHDGLMCLSTCMNASSLPCEYTYTTCGLQQFIEFDRVTQDTSWLLSSPPSNGLSAKSLCTEVALTYSLIARKPMFLVYVPLSSRYFRTSSLCELRTRAFRLSCCKELFVYAFLGSGGPAFLAG